MRQNGHVLEHTLKEGWASHENRIRRSSESRVKRALSHLVAKNRKNPAHILSEPFGT
jgi:hypothetical protein